jgi:cytochrome c
MKKILTILFFTIIIGITVIAINGCYVSQKTEAKSGAQLWAENCNRCHNAPGPGEFSNTNWEIVGAHMQVRANISKTDINKIVDFLKSANN